MAGGGDPAVSISILIMLLLLGDGAGDGGTLVLSVVVILISRRPDGASRMSSRALLALRDLVSFVEEEPGPKLDIDVSRFEAR